MGFLDNFAACVEESFSTFYNYLFNLLGMILYHLIRVTKTPSPDKPALEDLHFFLEFQVPRQWAPLFCELPLRHQRKRSSCPSLQFYFLGPKINVSSTQVIYQSMHNMFVFNGHMS